MNIYNYLFILFLFLCYAQLVALNRFNHCNNKTPEICAQYQNGGSIYFLKHSYLSFYPTFAFTKKDFSQDKLNKHTTISISSTGQIRVSTALLNNLFNRVTEEVLQGKEEFKDFIVLQKKNFNRKKCCGLLVLKCKQFPFVLKLFMETPKTFINPYCKGIEPICLFYMARGASRHTTGLTRIKNLKQIRQKLASMPQWRDVALLPRKWFWMPDDPRWIKITGKNIDNLSQVETVLPGIYGVCADYIDPQKGYSLAASIKRDYSLRLCNDLNLAIDPHTKNFIFFLKDRLKINGKKDKVTSENIRMVIIDTEHFPTMTGYNEVRKFNNYPEWYLYLAGKCFKDTYMRTKSMRVSSSLPNYRLL